MALEDAIGTKIPDEVIAKLDTVGKVVAYLKENKVA
jgi:acyl carrier protein